MQTLGVQRVPLKSAPYPLTWGFVSAAVFACQAVSSRIREFGGQFGGQIGGHVRLAYVVAHRGHGDRRFGGSSPSTRCSSDRRYRWNPPPALGPALAGPCRA